jgi:hypothetical protein
MGWHGHLGTAAAVGVLLLVGGPARQSPVAARQAGTQPTAVVTPRSAEFSIPVPHEGSWRWYRTTTPDNDLEYRWLIGVSSRGVEYELGFSLYKFPGSAEGVGDLAQLLKVGQASLWRRSPDGGSLVAGATVSVFVRDGGIVIRVPDAATVRMLFADRPSTARVLARTPDGDESKEISIAYRE